MYISTVGECDPSKGALLSASKEKFMETNDVDQQSWNNQMQEWKTQAEKAEINLLAAKISNAGANEEIIYSRELDMIRAKQREAAQKAKESKNAGSNDWGRIKAMAYDFLDKLRSSLSQGITRFK
jgi:hypothetical protein